MLYMRVFQLAYISLTLAPTLKLTLILTLTLTGPSNGLTLSRVRARNVAGDRARNAYWCRNGDD